MKLQKYYLVMHRFRGKLKHFAYASSIHTAQRRAPNELLSDVKWYEKQDGSIIEDGTHEKKECTAFVFGAAPNHSETNNKHID